MCKTADRHRELLLETLRACEETLYLLGKRETKCLPDGGNGAVLLALAGEARATICQVMRDTA